jgi:hypothetical protein
MNEAALMELAERRGNADGEPQKFAQLHRRAKQSREQLTAGVIKHQQWLAAFSHQFEWPHCPRAIELIFQVNLVGEAIKAGG